MGTIHASGIRPAARPVRRTGACPTCHRRAGLRVDGTLTRHPGVSGVCDGSWGAPLGASVEEFATAQVRDMRNRYGQRLIHRDGQWVCGEPAGDDVCGLATLCDHTRAALLRAPVRVRVAFLREHRGLSQKTFGELVGRSQSWAEKVEYGSRSRALDRVSMLRTIAAVLRVDEHLLFAPAEVPARQVVS